VFLGGNPFQNSSESAPFSLCTLSNVKEFDLANDTALCPLERNILSIFYDSAKGAEWTDRSNWKDEYESCCNWKGVTCGKTNQVIKLNLRNNGLSGRLSKIIGNLTSMEVLDLSDNDMKVILMCTNYYYIVCFDFFHCLHSSNIIVLLAFNKTQLNSQGSIPTEIGLLSNLTYLRLSYNAFTGTAPEGLGELTKLQLLQLQSNRITEMPAIPRLEDSIFKFNESTFVTDCGVPSAFSDPMECENCTMCCEYKCVCFIQITFSSQHSQFPSILTSCTR